MDFAIFKKATELAVTRVLRLGKGARLEVTDSSGTVRTISPDELASMLDVESRIVALNVTTTLTAAIHGNKMLLLGGAGSARTMTLPAASGSGVRFTFIVGAVNTSNYVVKVADASDTIDGVLLNTDTDTSGALRGFSPAASDDTITLNGSTTGGASIGDYFELIDIAADQWALRGMVSATGAPATPFSATV